MGYALPVDATPLQIIHKDLNLKTVSCFVNYFNFGIHTFVNLKDRQLQFFCKFETY